MRSFHLGVILQIECRNLINHKIKGERGFEKKGSVPWVGGELPFFRR